MDTKWDGDDSKNGEFEKMRKHLEQENAKACFLKWILRIQWGVDTRENRPKTVKEVIRRVTESIVMSTKQ